MPLTYGFDTDGKILSIADNGGVRNFTYDETLQVTGGGYAGAPESYAYDPEGNRTSSHLSATYSHDTANRLREDEDACYEYDENGNLITKTAQVGFAGCIGGVTSYEWDVLNRLVRIDNPDGSIFGLPLRRPGPAHREGRQRRVNQIRLRWRRNSPGISTEPTACRRATATAKRSTSRWP